MGSIESTGSTVTCSRVHARTLGTCRIEEHQHLRVRRPHDQLGDAVARRPKRTDRLAAGKPGKPACTLLRRAGLLDQDCSQHAGQQGHGRKCAPKLLAKDRQLDQPEPLPAVLLGDRDPRPAKLAKLTPEHLVETTGLGMLAYALRPGPLCQQLAGGALDLALVCAQAEVHQPRLPAVANVVGPPETPGTPNSGAPPGAEPIPITIT